MTLEEDLNKIVIAKKLNNSLDVSFSIHKQVETIENYPDAQTGKKIAMQLKRWLEWRKEYDEEYPYIERATNQYLSLYSSFARLFKRKR